jgi:hypothetical protein
MSISQYSPDGKFESGSFMNGMWSGPQGTNPNQGLMGLGQQPQQGQPQDSFTMGMPQYNLGYTPPDFNDPKNLASYQPPQQDTYGFDTTGNYVGANMPTGGFNQFGNRIDTPMQPNYMGQLSTQEVPNPFMNQGAMPDNQGAMLSDAMRRELNPNYVAPNYTAQDVQTAMRSPEFDSNYYQNANVLDAQGNPMSAQARQQLIQPFFNQQQQPNPAMQAPQTMQAQQPPQFFQPQPMQPSNPVNTQSVQPNFMGQTPFGQAQTGQFTSTNPFVQAAQANAQGNIAGALQATAANRINQQTPYGSLSYQQTGTDAQGNPIWSANQNLSPELQNLTQSSLAGLQASQANPMYGINPGDTYSNAIMQRLAPQQSQAREALDAQLANQGIMPGSEAYNRAKTLLGQTQNDALTSAIVGGMQTGLQAQGLQNTTAANIRNLSTPGYVTPYNQAAVAGPDYLSAYTSQNATDIARQNAEAAQRSSLLSTLGGLGSSAILGGTGANSALGGLLGLGSKGLESLGNSSLWNSLFGTGPAITGDQDFLKSIGLAGSTYGSGIEGMATDPLAGLYTNTMTDAENLDYINNLFDWGM